VLALKQWVFRRGGQAQFRTQTAPRLAPRPDTPLAEAEQEAVEDRAKKSEFRQKRGQRQNRRIVNRQKAERLKHGGRPGDALLLGYQPGGKRENMGNQEVGSLGSRQRVFVRLPQDRHDEFMDDAFRAFAEVHDAPHQVRVGVKVRAVGPHRPEGNAQRLHLLAVVAAGRNDGLVPSFLQT
jgi:hypothetical protein